MHALLRFRSPEVVKVTLHVLNLLLVLSKVALQTIIFLGESWVVRRLRRRYLLGGRVWWEGRLVQSATHFLVVINVLLQALDSQFVTFSLLLEVPISFVEIWDQLSVWMLGAAFFFKNLLKLFESVLLVSNLRSEVVVVARELVDLLVQWDFLVLKSRYFALQLSLVCFLIVGDTLECHKLFVDLVALGHNTCLAFSCLL